MCDPGHLSHCRHIFLGGHLEAKIEGTLKRACFTYNLLTKVTFFSLPPQYKLDSLRLVCVWFWSPYLLVSRPLHFFTTNCVFTRKMCGEVNRHPSHLSHLVIDLDFFIPRTYKIAGWVHRFFFLSYLEMQIWQFFRNNCHIANCHILTISK